MDKAGINFPLNLLNYCKNKYFIFLLISLENLGGQPPCKPLFSSDSSFVFWGSAAFIVALIFWRGYFKHLKVDRA